MMFERSPDDPLPLVYACSGCSNVAQLANDLALRLDRAGAAAGGMADVAGLLVGWTPGASIWHAFIGEGSRPSVTARLPNTQIVGQPTGFTELREAYRLDAQLQMSVS